MHTLTFKLKQQTPLIHFHNQQGATLRVTEVKPKLDKYLIEIMGGVDEASSNYSQWLIPKTKQLAFDYRLKIVAPSVVNEEILEGAENRIPFYFGNMGREYVRNPKYLSFTNVNIEVTITSFNCAKIDNETIVDYIRSIIATFFLKENFGTRQSKGYGSFYISEDDEIYDVPKDIIGLQHGSGAIDFLQYSFNLTGNGGDNKIRSLDVLRKLEIFYKAMRSGINVCFGRNKHYLKSLLWLYYKRMIDTNLKWEKKKIKEIFLIAHPDTSRQILEHTRNPGYINSPLGSTGVNEILIKDLFGLALEETWKAQYKFDIEKSIEGIDRFKSPVFFKPIRTDNNFIIFFHALSINPANSILDKSVEINKTLRIPTPATFDFHKFFDFLSNPSMFNLDNHMLVNAINNLTGNLESMRVTDIKSQHTNEHNRIENYKVLNNIIKDLQRN